MKQKVNKKCSCYDYKIERHYAYDAFGKPESYGIKVPICNGTKERDTCSCNGDRCKCDFYPHVREKAIIEQNLINVIRCRECKYYTNNKNIFVQYCTREGLNMTVNDMDYCSRGKRMENKE